MAEFHILGQLLCATKFHDKSSIFCRYSFQAGPNWTIVSGCPEGQTVSAELDYDQTVVWAHPLDIHYVTKGVQGWPKLILQVSCLDSLGRSWIIGYGCCSLPVVPGAHTLNINCWVPSTTTLTDKIRQYFLGGSHQLIQSDIIHLGLNRSKLTTKSQGIVQLQINLVLRNFHQFGVEYK